MEIQTFTRRHNANLTTVSPRGLLITGATGNVGREVVLAAARAGRPATAALRRPDAARGIPADFPTTLFDFHDPASWAPALAGHDSVFLVRPPAIADVQRNLNPFIDTAYSNGVRHIVFLSVAGADRNSMVPHAKVEKHLAASGGGYTLFRPGFFAQNLQDAYLADILEDNRILLPAGQANVNWIDTRDIADLAMLVLADPPAHQAKGYALTGPAAVSWQHVSRFLSEVTGRRIEYQAVSVPRYLWHLWRRRLPVGAIVIQTILHVLLRYEQGARYDPTLEQLLGRPSRSIETYIRDNAGLWCVDADR